MKKIIYFLVLLIFACHTQAQIINLKTIKTETDNFPKLITALQIYDASDEPVTGLTKSNFQVNIDGRKCDSLNAITYKESGLGFNIILCIDISGTMKGSPLDTVKVAISKFIDEMRAVDKLAIMGFADEPELISDFSNDKEYLRHKVNEIKTKGTQTALYYAGYKSLKKLAGLKEKTAKILIIMGDGKNETKSTSYTEDDIINLALQEGIPSFNVGYTNIDKSYLRSLERISDKTNGKYYESPNDEELDRQYEKLHRQLLNIYLLSYQICGMDGDGNEHLNNVSVLINNVLKKNISNKFIAPAGATKIQCNDEVIIKKSTSFLWLYITLICIVIAIIVGYVYWKKRKKKDDIPVDNMLNSFHNKNLPDEVESHHEPIREEELISTDRTIILNHSANTNVSTLVIEMQKGEFANQSFDLVKQGATIGRNNNNSIALTESPTISSYHAVINYINGSFTIEDKNSTNGTYINGNKILVHTISNGDIFKMGSCEGIFYIK